MDVVQFFRHGFAQIVLFLHMFLFSISSTSMCLMLWKTVKHGAGIYRTPGLTVPALDLKQRVLASKINYHKCHKAAHIIELLAITNCLNIYFFLPQ